MKILITGGASGLGKAITEKVANEPSNMVYITYNSSIVNAQQLEKEYKNIRSFHLDYSSEESINKFVADMSDLAPEAIINNAFSGYTQIHFHKIEKGYFGNGFKINIYPVIRLMQEFILISRKRKFGKIITILTSAVINKPPVGFSEYVASKAYLFSLSKSWASENGAFGITSNCISPSFMETKLTENTDSRVVETMMSENYNRKLLTTAEVADTVMFLLNASPQINGVNLVINSARDIL